MCIFVSKLSVNKNCVKDVANLNIFKIMNISAEIVKSRLQKSSPRDLYLYPEINSLTRCCNGK